MLFGTDLYHIKHVKLNSIPICSQCVSKGEEVKLCCKRNFQRMHHPFTLKPQFTMAEGHITELCRLASNY